MHVTEPKQSPENGGEETIDVWVEHPKRGAESQSVRLIVLGLVEEASRLVRSFIEKVKNLYRRAYSFVRNRLFHPAEEADA